MEAHAQMSFEFLQRIAWPPHLSRIPAIAHAHHEKLDGSGYPLGLHAEEIPLLARMMTVADIFDALTANDRPYKKAMTPERAFHILREEAARGQLDSDIVELFIDREIYRHVGIGLSTPPQQQARPSSMSPLGKAASAFTRTFARQERRAL